MIRIKKYFAVVICLFVLPGLWGCGKETSMHKVVFTTGFRKNEVFRLEESVCSLQEIMIYLVNTQKGYEKNFGSEIWSAEADSSTVESRLKESILAKTAQIKAMNLLASEKGITLSGEEIQKAREAADEYYSTLTPQDIAAMKGATADDVFKVYEEYALADKLYDYIIQDINPEVSDDEARTITVEQIFLKTYSLNAAGEKVSFGSTAKNTVLGKMKSIKSQLAEGTGFEELMGNYNEADENTLSFGKGDMPEEYEKAAFNLGTDEISNIVEIPDGYVIIKCISTFNPEETQENKTKIVEKRKKEVFGEQYDDYVSTLTKELNEDLWKTITVSTEEGAETSSLWDVYEKYFGEK